MAWPVYKVVHYTRASHLFTWYISYFGEAEACFVSLWRIRFSLLVFRALDGTAFEGFSYPFVNNTLAIWPKYQTYYLTHLGILICSKFIGNSPTWSCKHCSILKLKALTSRYRQQTVSSASMSATFLSARTT